MHGDPIGYFLTWVTYGTWLPGDARGWVQYKAGWQLPDPIREREAKALMTEDACILTAEQRRAVEPPSLARKPFGVDIVRREQVRAKLRGVQEVQRHAASAQAR